VGAGGSTLQVVVDGLDPPFCPPVFRWSLSDHGDGRSVFVLRPLLFSNGRSVLTRAARPIGLSILPSANPPSFFMCGVPFMGQWGLLCANGGSSAPRPSWISLPFGMLSVEP